MVDKVTTVPKSKVGAHIKRRAHGAVECAIGQQATHEY
jgi:hypothetical protein